MRVLILSPQSSGNRFMQASLARCGLDVSVAHAHKANAVEINDYVVVMVRGLARWSDSLNAHPFGLDPKATHQEGYRAIFTEVLKYQKPFTVVSYESLVSDPEDTMKTLCEWMGVEWPGWNGERTDPKRRAWSGPPVDGNAKYREVATC